MNDGERVMAIAKIAYRSNEVNQEIWRLFKKHVDINNLYSNYITGCGCPNDISHRWRELLEDCLQNPIKYNSDDNFVDEEPIKKSSKVNKK